MVKALVPGGAVVVGTVAVVEVPAGGAATEKSVPVVTVTSAPPTVGPRAMTTTPESERSTASAAPSSARLL